MAFVAPLELGRKPDDERWIGRFTRWSLLSVRQGGSSCVSREGITPITGIPFLCRRLFPWRGGKKRREERASGGGGGGGDGEALWLAGSLSTVTSLHLHISLEPSVRRRPSSAVPEGA
uniref:Uncharacterized protein n=1 Tax=Oryza punctata TaxID=4537 RepID=A0A0E0KCI0_ORYPU